MKLALSFGLILLLLPTTITPAQKQQDSLATAAQQQAIALKLPPAPPLLSSVLCGSGVYLLSMNGQPVGREDFEVECPSVGGFSAKAHTDLRVPGATIDLHTTLELDASAIPSKFTIKGMAAGTPTEQTLIMKDGMAKLTANGATREVPYAAGSSFVSPNLFYLIPFLAARYDVAKGGAQELPVFPNIKARMERTAHDGVSAAGFIEPGLPQSFDRYTVSFGVLTTVLWADARGRIAVIFVPMQNFVAVREEYANYVGPLRAAMASAAKAAAPDYSAPADAPFTSEEVTIQSKDVSLAGTLLAPKNGKPPYPAVVTITGSGQQTRDEAIPLPGLEKYRPFRQIAETLASHGIAVLRVDDRGVGNSTGFDTLTKVTTFDFADDTRAQIAFLRTRKDIDPNRIALLGHSEGAIIAPLVAASDPRIAAVVLMAGTAETGEAVIMDQVADVLDRDPLTTQEARAAKLAEQEKMLHAAINGDNSLPLPAAMKLPWYKAFLTYNPLPTIRKVHQPILILQGALDRQVTASQASLLEKAARAAGNHDVTVRVFPHLNHLFLPATTGAVSEYASLPTASIGENVLGTLDDWLQLKLKVKH